MAFDLTQMNESRKEGKYTDFTIIAEGKKFPVHCLVLDNRSEYFRLLLKSKMKERQEKCSDEKDTTATAVKQAICAMYGEKLELNKSNASEVLKICHRWQLHPQVTECKGFLMENLDGSNTIETLKLAIRYKLQDLAKLCNEAVATNPNVGNVALLESTEVEAVLVSANSMPAAPSADLWKFCIEWVQLQKPPTSVCETLRVFPQNLFRSLMSSDIVWGSQHIKNCSECRNHFKASAISLVTEGDVENDTSIFFKYLSKEFQESNVEQREDDYTVTSENLVAHLEIGPDDFLEYIKTKRHKYTKEEFSAVIRWMKHATERERVFPGLFASKDGSHSHSGGCIGFSKRRGGDWKDIQWLVEAKDCFYMKQLAEKYGIPEAQKAVDDFVVENYSEVSKMLEFKELSLADVKNYIESVDRSDESIQWAAAISWVTHNIEDRRQHFPSILNSLSLAKFSTEFMRETVLRCNLVQTSDSCMTKIMFARMMKLEDEVSDLKKRRSVRKRY